MYSLDINFLNDRPEFAPEASSSAPTAAVTPTANPLPAILGLLVAIALPAGTFGAKVYLEGERAKLTTERDNLTTELANLNAQLGQVATLEAEEAQINAEIDSLVAVFGKVQPMSALLQEVSNQIPASLRINTLNVSGTTLELTGTSSSYADLTDFILLLKQSKFLQPEAIKLTSSTPGTSPLQVEVEYLEDLIAAAIQEANPNEPAPEVTPPEERPQVNYTLPEVVNYSLTTQLTNPDATEVLDELRSLGAEGIVERIEVLQQRGII
ncbi:MAG: PilN domain-containing protein [Prochlorotrichaceae cyanobacterium]